MAFFKDFRPEQEEKEFNPNDYNMLLRDGELPYNYLCTELIAAGCPEEEINNMIARLRLISAYNASGLKSAAELVEKSGVNKGSISQYINGLHIPSSNNAKKLAEVFGVNPLWLMAFDAPRYYSGYTQSNDVEPLHEKIIEKFDALEENQKQLILKMLDIN